MIGIGEISTGIAVAKDSLSLLKYFRKVGLNDFKKSSLPLEQFYKQEVTIVSSSLLAPKNDKTNKHYSLVKPMKDEKGEWKNVPIGSGYKVTGIFDAFGLTKMSIALIQRNSEISLAIDSIDDNLKKEHLCLIGGKSSNLLARELYYDFIPAKYHFYGSEGGIDIHGKNFRGGGYGHILFMKNPWNTEKKVIWLAGLGPLGTGAAIDFVIDYFQDKAPSELRNKDGWILFVKGVAKNGVISNVHQIGHYLISYKCIVQIGSMA